MKRHEVSAGRRHRVSVSGAGGPVRIGVPRPDGALTGPRQEPSGSKWIFAAGGARGQGCGRIPRTSAASSSSRPAPHDLVYPGGREPDRGGERADGHALGAPTPAPSCAPVRPDPAAMPTATPGAAPGVPAATWPSAPRSSCTPACPACKCSAKWTRWRCSWRGSYRYPSSGFPAWSMAAIRSSLTSAGTCSAISAVNSLGWTSPRSRCSHCRSWWFHCPVS